MIGKAEALEALKKEMEANTLLPLSESANLVFGDGDPEAKILFIGEAPGLHENEQRRPFVGRAGQLLDKLFLGVKIPRESVYITNIVKRRPPENRDPLPEEIEAYKPYLTRQIEIISPSLIITLGRFAMNYFLPEAKISQDHGHISNYQLPTTNYSILLYPLYHPAAALRSTGVLHDLELDFAKISKILS